MSIDSVFTREVAMDAEWFAMEKEGFPRSKALNWESNALGWAAAASAALQSPGATLHPKHLALGARYDVTNNRVNRIREIYPLAGRKGTSIGQDIKEGLNALYVRPATEAVNAIIPGGWTGLLIGSAVLLALYIYVKAKD